MLCDSTKAIDEKIWNKISAFVAGTCTVASTKCNCDKNLVGPPELSDEGYITNKWSLPVTAFWMGDAGDIGERGWHSLGTLQCSGGGKQLP